MRSDLLRMIAKERDVSNMVVLTHNIDFLFIQSLLLPMLRRIGEPALTIFADAGCAAESYARQAPIISKLGVRYRVVPVAMRSGFRFHPKALFLSGKEKGSLFIGSGNLTFGGWRENGEVWAQFNSGEDGTGSFAAFRGYLDEIVNSVPLAEPVREAVDDAFDPERHRWAVALDQPSGLIGKYLGGVPLIARILQEAGQQPATRLTICAPYFDDHGVAACKLVEAFGSPPTTLLLQHRGSGLSRSAGDALSGVAELKGVRFQRDTVSGEKRETFLHAKFYGVEQGKRVLLFIGSANCSRAALLVPGEAGNAELVAVRNISREEFQTNWVAELEVMEEEPILKELPQPEEPEHTSFGFRILAARYEGAMVKVAYTSSATTHVSGCFVNESIWCGDLRHPDVGILEFDYDSAPTRIQLDGIGPNGAIRSQWSWVDHEASLGTTSKERLLREAIIANVQSDRWGLGTWREIMEMFTEHLLEITPYARVRGEGKEAPDPIPFTVENVFASDYGLPVQGLGMVRLYNGDRVASLQQLLLRWFRIEAREDAVMNRSMEVERLSGTDEEEVDQPIALPISPVSKSIHGVTVAERKRVRKLLDSVAECMTSLRYITHCEPKRLADDLMLASLLLRTALGEQWIDREDFFRCTLAIWSRLFFTSEGDPTRGWLERRYVGSENLTEFRSRMASSRLSASIALWAMAVPARITSVEHACFALACCLSLVRFSWVWRGGAPEAIATELAAYLHAVINPEEGGTWQDVEVQWLTLIRRGEALRRLYVWIDSRTPAQLAGLVHVAELTVGELLWQGEENGFCIVLKPCRRQGSNNVNVYRLQKSPSECSFRALQTIPVRGLLELALADGFVKMEEGTVLKSFLDDLKGSIIPYERPAPKGRIAETIAEFTARGDFD